VRHSGTTAEAFYRITDAAYERRSMTVTSNIHPFGFDTIMPKSLATATVDRLTASQENTRPSFRNSQ
jgi:hypothetical protein